MNICTPSRRRKDVTVTCNTLAITAAAGKILDGMDALVWLLKRMGGTAHYSDVLREVKNSKRFGKWLTNRFHGEGGR